MCENRDVNESMQDLTTNSDPNVRCKQELAAFIHFFSYPNRSLSPAMQVTSFLLRFVGILSFGLFLSTTSLSPTTITTTSMSAAAKAILALNTKCIVKGEFLLDFQKALCSNAVQTLEEPGCLQIVVGKDANLPDKNVFYVHDQFVDLQAYQEHEGLPHFRDFLERVRPMLEAPPVSNKLLLHKDDNNGDSTASSAIQKPSPPTTYCLNVESVIKPHLRDDFVQLLTNHAIHSRSEPACLQFDWGESLDAPNSFYMHEEYTDLAGFQAHTVSPHFARFVKFNKEQEPYEIPQVVDFYETIPIQ